MAPYLADHPPAVGGFCRYLEQAVKEFDAESYHLVTEALEERAHMLYAAPFMVKPLPIMIPVYKWWEVPYMWIGAKAYDFVSGSSRKVPRSRFINRVRNCEEPPALL